MSNFIIYTVECLFGYQYSNGNEKKQLTHSEQKCHIDVWLWTFFCDLNITRNRCEWRHKRQSKHRSRGKNRKLSSFSIEAASNTNFDHLHSFEHWQNVWSSDFVNGSDGECVTSKGFRILPTNSSRSIQKFQPKKALRKSKVFFPIIFQRCNEIKIICD